MFADPQPESLDLWVRRYLQRVVNDRDVGAVDELVAPDYAGFGAGWPADRDELRAFYTWQAAYRSDWHIDVKATVEVADWVAVRADAGGSVAFDTANQPLAVPYRRAVEWLAVFRVERGLLVETRILAVRGRAI